MGITREQVFFSCGGRKWCGVKVRSICFRLQRVFPPDAANPLFSCIAGWASLGQIVNSIWEGGNYVQSISGGVTFFNKHQPAVECGQSFEKNSFFLRKIGTQKADLRCEFDFVMMATSLDGPMIHCSPSPSLSRRGGFFVSMVSPLASPGSVHQ